MFVLEHYIPVGFLGNRGFWQQDAVSNDHPDLEEELSRKSDPENWRIREVASLALKGYVEDADD